MSTTYSPTNKPEQFPGTIAAVAAACVVVVVLAAVAGFAFGRHVTSAITPSASAHTVTPANHSVTPTANAATVPSSAMAAIKSFETQNGPGAGKWAIETSQVSKANAKYVFFRIGAAKGFEDSVQGGYGFALHAQGKWSVVGFGSAQVGCPMSESHTAVVPAAVLTEFGFGCPSN